MRPISMEARPIPPHLVMDGLREYEEAGELSQDPRVRHIVVGIVEFLKATDDVMTTADDS